MGAAEGLIPLRPLLPYPALLIENEKRILVVADLHIGWEWDTRFIEAGLYIPSQTSKLQTKLEDIIEKYNPHTLILLGDIKQAITRISIEDWRIIPTFFENLHKQLDEIIVVLGNHDGELEPLTPSTVKIYPSRGIRIGQDPSIGLFHGHAWPSPQVLSADILVMGHIHPVVWFKDKLGLWTVKQAWIVTTSQKDNLAQAYLQYLNINPRGTPQDVLESQVGIRIRDPRVIILPAFNDLVGGVSVNRLKKRLLGPIIRSNGLNLEDAEVYLQDGTYLGVVKHLQQRYNE